MWAASLLASLPPAVLRVIRHVRESSSDGLTPMGGPGYPGSKS